MTFQPCRPATIQLLPYVGAPLRKEPSMGKHGRLFCVEDVKGGKNYLTKLLAKVCARLQK